MTVEATVNEMRAVVELARLDARRETAELRSAREQLLHSLNPALRQRYQRLTQRDPVVPIVSGACGGCHLRLPTMVAARAMRGSLMHVCPSCSRLLYVPGLVDPPGETEGPTAAGRGRRRVGRRQPASGHRS